MVLKMIVWAENKLHARNILVPKMNLETCELEAVKIEKEKSDDTSSRDDSGTGSSSDSEEM